MTHERRTGATQEARESAEASSCTSGAESAGDANLDGASWVVVSPRPMGGRSRPRIASVIPAAPPPAPPLDRGGDGDAPPSEPSSPEHDRGPSSTPTGEPTAAAGGTLVGASTDRECRRNMGGRGHRSPGRPPPAQLPLEGGGDGEGGAPQSEPSSPAPDAPSTEPSGGETASARGTVRVTDRGAERFDSPGVVRQVRQGRRAHASRGSRAALSRRRVPSATRHAFTQQRRARARVTRCPGRYAPGVTLGTREGR